jgi:hypothetical protein
MSNRWRSYHLISRDDRTGALLAKGVAQGTVPIENVLPFGRSLVIEGKWILRGLNLHEILLNPLQAGTVSPVLKIAIHPLFGRPVAKR